VRPHLDHLKKQAKDLLRAEGAPTLQLAQLAVARRYGFPSWPKLKAAVVGGPLRDGIAVLREGGMVLLFDDEARENEGDLVLAAEHVTAENLNRLLRHARGTLCLAMAPELIDRLGLPLVSARASLAEPAFTFSIDAAAGITTGVSAADRAATVRAAIADDAGPQSVRSPGHVFPLRAEAGGLAVRRGHTEGAVALMQRAGLKPAAVICEVLNEDGSMARWHDLEGLAGTLGVPLLKMSDLEG